MYESVDGTTITLQLMVPGKYHQQIVQELHRGALGGHLGADKTHAKLKERFYWPGYLREVRLHCEACTSCDGRFSVPEQLHSDQGKQFESKLISTICQLLQVKKSRTTPYHPQSDGLVERFNRTLTNMLASTAKENPFEWESHLGKVCLAYNTSVHTTTGHTPFFLMFGRQAQLLVDQDRQGTKHVFIWVCTGAPAYFWTELMTRCGRP